MPASDLASGKCQMGYWLVMSNAETKPRHLDPQVMTVPRFCAAKAKGRAFGADGL